MDISSIANPLMPQVKEGSEGKVEGYSADTEDNIESFEAVVRLLQDLDTKPVAQEEDTDDIILSAEEDQAEEGHNLEDSIYNVAAIAPMSQDYIVVNEVKKEIGNTPLDTNIDIDTTVFQDNTQIIQDLSVALNSQEINSFVTPQNTAVQNIAINDELIAQEPTKDLSKEFMTIPEPYVIGERPWPKPMNYIDSIPLDNIGTNDGKIDLSSDFELVPNEELTLLDNVQLAGNNEQLISKATPQAIEPLLENAIQNDKLIQENVEIQLEATESHHAVSLIEATENITDQDTKELNNLDTDAEIDEVSDLQGSSQNMRYRINNSNAPIIRTNVQTTETHTLNRTELSEIELTHSQVEETEEESSIIDDATIIEETATNKEEISEPRMLMKRFEPIDGKATEISREIKAEMNIPETTLMSDQIVPHIAHMPKGVNNFVVEMDPKELGPVNAIVTMEDGGQMSLLLTAKNTEILNILASEASQLKDKLGDSDIVVNKIGFGLTQDSSQHQHQGNNNNNNNWNNLNNQLIGASYKEGNAIQEYVSSRNNILTETRVDITI